ncbi:AMP-dependent synthetase/ligase [Actinomadura rugatobispora]|uniref:Acyl-CoA synthetase n=1 Tax=Actinomadura rugatobispora TaxID=1994 RepID=A0ABW1A8H2_9ACTN|nr:AMP-dependent synthetase/ligase [Actinomadura rugatobispora]
MSPLPDGCERTVPALLHYNARHFGESTALTTGVGPGTHTVTWARLRDDVAAFALGLRALGLRRGDRMLIMMSKRPEHWVADLAAAHLGAISCSAYDTLSTADIRHAARHSAAHVIVLEGAEQVTRWMPVLDELPRSVSVVVVDPTAVPDDDRFVGYTEVHGRGVADPESAAVLEEAVRPDDPLCMIYTSGTTGAAKGVVLSHRNVLEASAALHASSPVPEQPRSISYLPLAHIAERLFGIYLPLLTAGQAVMCPDPAELPTALRIVRPDTFGAVPRTWEKLAAALRSTLDGLPATERVAVDEARRFCLDVHRRRAARQQIPPEESARLAELDVSRLRALRAAVGLENARRLTVGAAPIPTKVLEFLASVGLPVLELYGLSETSGVVSLSTPDRFATGAVGAPIPGTEVRIADDGEIRVRGPVVFLGYLRADGTVEPDTDTDGWLATGDLGRVDDDGLLYITGRKKDILITSGGKNIAPAKIEAPLRTHPLIGHALVVGDRRKYVTALLTLDEQTAPDWARAHDVGTADLAELAAHPVVLAEIDRLVAAANTELSRVEQVKAFRVLAAPWTTRTGELTPTLKVRRSAVTERYAAQIDDMYPRQEGRSE